MKSSGTIDFQNENIMLGGMINNDLFIFSAPVPYTLLWEHNISVIFVDVDGLKRTPIKQILDDLFFLIGVPR